LTKQNLVHLTGDDMDVTC